MILITANISDKHKEWLKTEFPAQTFMYGETSEEIMGYINDAEIIVTYGSDLTDEMIKQAANLKWVMVLSAGIEKLPVKRLTEKGVRVTNVRGIHQIPMAEYAISMLLQVYRNEKQIIENERQQQWNQAVRLNEITGKTMLVVGAGAIGQEVARLAKAFRMKTIGVSRSGRKLAHFDENYQTKDLETVLPQADFLVSILPSTMETANFYTDKHFEMLPNHAVFLNMGRGNAVKTDVVLKAVQHNEIAHAVLDVAEQEPLPKESPLWKEENITITPHLSGHSPHYVKRAITIFADNLHKYLEGTGELTNQMDITRGY